MIRAVFTTGRWLGVEIRSAADDAKMIDSFMQEGTPVLVVDCIESAEELGVEIEMIEDDG